MQNSRPQDLANLRTYNSEVWGTFGHISIPGTPLQSKGAHLQFCKRYLELHNKASNMASRDELGKYPMIIDINKKILNYLSYQNKNLVLSNELIKVELPP